MRITATMTFEELTDGIDDLLSDLSLSDSKLTDLTNLHPVELLLISHKKGIFNPENKTRQTLIKELYRSI